MDLELLLNRLDQRYVSRREMVNRIPLGISQDDVWRGLLERRRSKCTPLPLCNAKGSMYWYVTTDRMVSASEKIVEELMANETETDPFGNGAPLFPLQELFFTSYIEGASISMQDAMLFLQSDTPPRDAEEQIILNNRYAGSFVSSNLYRPVDENYLQNLAYILTDGLDNGGAELRAADYIEVPFMMDEPFELPTARVLPDRLRELVTLLRSPDIHPLIKAGVAQVWVLVMRPFPEGNDRLARLLSEMLLHQAGYTFFGDVSLSALMARNTFSYFSAASNVFRAENGGDMTYFLEYYLGLLARAVDERHLTQKKEDDEFLESQRQMAAIPLRPPKPIRRESSVSEDISESEISLDGYELVSVTGKDEQPPVIEGEHPAISDIRTKLFLTAQGNGLRIAPAAKVLLDYLDREKYFFTSEQLSFDSGLERTRTNKVIMQLRDKKVIRYRPGMKRTGNYEFALPSELIASSAVDYADPYDPEEFKKCISEADAGTLLTRAELRQELSAFTAQTGSITDQAVGILIRYLDEGRNVFRREALLAELSMQSDQLSSILYRLKKKGLIALSRNLKGKYIFLYDPEADTEPEDMLPTPEKDSDLHSYQNVLNDLLNSPYSQRDRRIAAMLQSCMESGIITFSVYKAAGEITKWVNDMQLAEQMGLVEKVSNSEYRLLFDGKPRFSLLRKSQRETISAIYKVFGERAFTVDMVIGELDCSSATVSAYLHQFTLLRILSCRKEDVNIYQFLVNPSDNPECFINAA